MVICYVWGFFVLFCFLRECWLCCLFACVCVCGFFLVRSVLCSD